jgi:hypothetical protein
MLSARGGPTPQETAALVPGIGWREKEKRKGIE